jgi:hypothetical protein
MKEKEKQTENRDHKIPNAGILRLEAFPTKVNFRHKDGDKPVDNRGTTLVIFLFRDPHLLEGGERGEDGSTDPDRVFTFRRSNNFNLQLVMLQ